MNKNLCGQFLTQICSVEIPYLNKNLINSANIKLC